MYLCIYVHIILHCHGTYIAIYVATVTVVKLTLTIYLFIMKINKDLFIIAIITIHS